MTFNNVYGNSALILGKTCQDVADSLTQKTCNQKDTLESGECEDRINDYFFDKCHDLEKKDDNKTLRSVYGDIKQKK